MKVKTLAAIAVMALWGAAAAYSGQAADRSKVADTSCKDVPDPFVASVGRPNRPEALQRLKDAQIVELTESQAETLLSEASTGKPLAVVHLDRAIADLKSQRRDELQFQKGSWGDDLEAELTGLSRMQSAGAAWHLKPFLVRAVMGFEGTGHFAARLCGDRLYVDHSSLGHWTPKPAPAAVIVFLPRKPSGVTADFEVAG